ncbi:MAG: hypothetical protein J6D52_12195 [Clostridia bacterium]|nr:hypothetical protein [Clostridia bacterium]
MIGEVLRWTIFLFIYAYGMIIQAQILEQWDWKKHCKDQVVPSFMSDGLNKKTFSEWEEYWQQQANNKQLEREHHTNLIIYTVLLSVMNLVLFFALGIFLSKGWWIALIIITISLIKAVIDFSKEIGSWKYREFDDE